VKPLSKTGAAARKQDSAAPPFGAERKPPFLHAHRATKMDFEMRRPRCVEWVFEDVPLGTESHWTIQELTGGPVPLCALHEQGDNGPTHGVYGSRKDVEEFCRDIGVTPEEVAPVDAAAYQAEMEAQEKIHPTKLAVVKWEGDD
jgi:hypothetical protein